MQQNLVTRSAEHPRMEHSEQHLADEYVQGFDLEHLEDITVKREEKGRSTTDPDTWVSHDIPNAKYSRSWSDERRLPPMSPSNESMYTSQPLFMNMTLINDPSTPPDTPPSNSPVPYNRPPGFMDEVLWFPPNMRVEPQPLDLRPNMPCMANEADWDRRDYVPSVISPENHPSVHHINLHQRPQSCSSSGSPVSPRGQSSNLTTSDYSSCESLTTRRHQTNVISSPCSENATRGQLLTLGSTSDYGSCVDLVPSRRQHSSGSVSEYSSGAEDYIISDKVLVALSVRELNKKVQHLPKDIITKLKMRRRTLKNRGYAQNCRHKRVKQRQDLEELNQNLTDELQKHKIEISALRQERDHLKQKIMLLNKSSQGGQIQQLNADGHSSPEFYL